MTLIRKRGTVEPPKDYCRDRRGHPERSRFSRRVLTFIVVVLVACWAIYLSQ